MCNERKISMGTPELLITTGLIGAGKTKFSRQLAMEREIAFINADEVRLEHFDRLTFSTDETQQVYDIVDEMAIGHLEQGESVICNGNYNRHAERERMKKIARRCGEASFFIILVEAPYDLLPQRMLSRDHEIPPERRVDPPLAVLDLIVSAYEHPGYEPPVIRIDGTQEYGDQEWVYDMQKYALTY